MSAKRRRRPIIFEGDLSIRERDGRDTVEVQSVESSRIDDLGSWLRRRTGHGSQARHELPDVELGKVRIEISFPKT